MADAFGFSVPVPEAFEAGAKYLLAGDTVEQGPPRIISGPRVSLPQNQNTSLLGFSARGIAERSFAASAFLLYGWALNRAERTEHTAIAFMRAQHHLALDALIEELTCISGHLFLLGEAAVRTGQHRFKNGFGHCSLSSFKIDQAASIFLLSVEHFRDPVRHPSVPLGKVHAAIRVPREGP